MSEPEAMQVFSHDDLMNYPNDGALKQIWKRAADGEFGEHGLDEPALDSDWDPSWGDRGKNTTAWTRADFELKKLRAARPPESKDPWIVCKGGETDLEAILNKVPSSRQSIEYLPESGLIRVPKAPRNPRDIWTGEWDHINPREIRTLAQLEALSVYRPPGYSMAEVDDTFWNAIEDSLTYAFGVEAEIGYERDDSGKLVRKTIFHELKPGELLEWPALVSSESVAQSWSDLEEVEANDESVLIGPGRWLTRGSGLLLVAPTGVGKSTWSATQCFTWSLGRESLGLRPNGPLKSLVFQAEDDDGDLAAMARGIISSLNPSHDERQLLRENVLVFTEKTHIGDTLLQRIIRPQLEVHQPDLLVINPLSTFAGCDLNKQEEIAKFLRVGLNALLAEFGCAAIIIHHIPKPSVGGHSN